MVRHTAALSLLTTVSCVAEDLAREVVPRDTPSSPASLPDKRVSDSAF